MFVYTRRIFPFSIAIRLKNAVFGLILNPIRTGMMISILSLAAFPVELKVPDNIKA